MLKRTIIALTLLFVAATGFSQKTGIIPYQIADAPGEAYELLSDETGEFQYMKTPIDSFSIWFWGNSYGANGTEVDTLDGESLLLENFFAYHGLGDSVSLVVMDTFTYHGILNSPFRAVGQNSETGTNRWRANYNLPTEMGKRFALANEDSKVFMFGLAKGGVTSDSLFYGGRIYRDTLEAYINAAKDEPGYDRPADVWFLGIGPQEGAGTESAIVNFRNWLIDTMGVADEQTIFITAKHNKTLSSIQEFNASIIHIGQKYDWLQVVEMEDGGNFPDGTHPDEPTIIKYGKQLYRVLTGRSVPNQNGIDDNGNINISLRSSLYGVPGFYNKGNFFAGNFWTDVATIDSMGRHFIWTPDSINFGTGVFDFINIGNNFYGIGALSQKQQLTTIGFGNFTGSPGIARDTMIVIGNNNGRATTKPIHVIGGYWNTTTANNTWIVASRDVNETVNGRVSLFRGISATTAYIGDNWLLDLSDVPSNGDVLQIVSGEAVWAPAAGGGTDDQTAVEVPITDAGGYYTGTEVETALQEIGADLAAVGSNIYSANGNIDGVTRTVSIINSGTLTFDGETATGDEFVVIDFGETRISAEDVTQIGVDGFTDGIQFQPGNIDFTATGSLDITGGGAGDILTINNFEFATLGATSSLTLQGPTGANIVVNSTSIIGSSNDDIDFNAQGNEINFFLDDDDSGTNAVLSIGADATSLLAPDYFPVAEFRETGVWVMNQDPTDDGTNTKALSRDPVTGVIEEVSLAGGSADGFIADDDATLGGDRIITLSGNNLTIANGGLSTGTLNFAAGTSASILLSCNSASFNITGSGNTATIIDEDFTNRNSGEVQIYIDSNNDGTTEKFEIGANATSTVGGTYDLIARFEEDGTWTMGQDPADDNSNTKALARDPVTGEIEEVTLSGGGGSSITYISVTGTGTQSTSDGVAADVDLDNTVDFGGDAGTDFTVTGGGVNCNFTGRVKVVIKVSYDITTAQRVDWYTRVELDDVEESEAYFFGPFGSQTGSFEWTESFVVGVTSGENLEIEIEWTQPVGTPTIAIDEANFEVTLIRLE